MQRYSGIVMSRRKKPNNETEAKMEGSGDDRETQDLAFLGVKFDKFQHTINLTKSKLLHHLDENQETNRRGQAKIYETLKNVDENLQKIDQNQSQITDLLMQMTHQGKDPETYGNKVVGESNGFHGEIRYNPEKAPRSKGSQGGGTSNGQMGSRVNPRPYIPTFIDEQLGRHLGSRANPRPYMPTFTNEQGQQEQVDDFFEQNTRCTKEYYSLDMRIQRQMSLEQYC
jgi:hypothetical protein